MAEEYFSKAEQKEAGDRIKYYESLRHLGVGSKNVAERTYDGRDHIWIQDRIDGKWLFWASKPQYVPIANGTVVDGKLITDSEIRVGDTVEFNHGHELAGRLGKVYGVSMKDIGVQVNGPYEQLVTVPKEAVTKVTDEK